MHEELCSCTKEITLIAPQPTWMGSFIGCQKLCTCFLLQKEIQTNTNSLKKKYRNTKTKNKIAFNFELNDSYRQVILTRMSYMSALQVWKSPHLLGFKAAWGNNRFSSLPKKKNIVFYTFNFAVNVTLQSPKLIYNLALAMLFCPVYWRVGGPLNPKAAVVRQTDLLGLKRDKTQAENPAFTESIG